MLIASWIKLSLQLLVVPNWSNNVTVLHISVNNHTFLISWKKLLMIFNEVGYFCTSMDKHCLWFE